MRGGAAVRLKRTAVILLHRSPLTALGHHPAADHRLAGVSGGATIQHQRSRSQLHDAICSRHRLRGSRLSGSAVVGDQKIINRVVVDGDLPGPQSCHRCLLLHLPTVGEVAVVHRHVVIEKLTAVHRDRAGEGIVTAQPQLLLLRRCEAVQSPVRVPLRDQAGIFAALRHRLPLRVVAVPVPLQQFLLLPHFSVHRTLLIAAVREHQRSSAHLARDLRLLRLHLLRQRIRIPIRRCRFFILELPRRQRPVHLAQLAQHAFEPLQLTTFLHRRRHVAVEVIELPSLGRPHRPRRAFHRQTDEFRVIQSTRGLQSVLLLRKPIDHLHLQRPLPWPRVNQRNQPHTLPTLRLLIRTHRFARNTR